MRYKILIPARYSSTRLEGKPLIKINGKSLIVRTFENVCKIFDPEKVVVVTDDKRIASELKKNNITFSIVDIKCESGTDRVAEYAKKIDSDYIINIQGDEPNIDPKDLAKVKEFIEKKENIVFNCYTKIDNVNEIESINTPKVVLNSNNELMYISRSVIPNNLKSQVDSIIYKQVCIYGFPRDILIRHYGQNMTKEPLERIEDIEILRLIEKGIKVKMIRMNYKSLSIDTQEDVFKLLDFYNAS